MTLKRSLKITLAAAGALALELLLYYLFVLDSAFEGHGYAITLSRSAIFWTFVIYLTAAAGLLAPVAALIEWVVKKENVAITIILTSLTLGMAGLTGIYYIR